MKSPADIIVELESDNSRLFKESVILREMESNNVEFFEGLQYALNNLITFGVKDINSYGIESAHEPTTTFEEFKVLLKNLENRDLSGNAAKSEIFSFGCKTSSHVWDNWYRRILLKDLKCGVSEATINKCAKKLKRKEYEIPVFSCQLAQDSRNHNSKLNGKKILQEKLDGTRILTVIYPDGRVDQFSRNGKEIVNFKHIKEEISSSISPKIVEPVVLDGEIMSENFQALMSQLYRKTDVQTKDSILFVFDMLTLREFSEGGCGVIQEHRSEQVSALVAGLNTVKVLYYIIVDMDTKEGKDTFENFNRKCIDAGKEGIMIKDIYSPYECKRSTSWLKLKPVMSVDLEIKDVQEGTDKYTGMLGALVCSGVEGDKEIFVNVGSGFTDEQRKLYWDNKSEIIGKIAEVKSDCITQNQNGTYSLRFPVFMRLRGFDIGEKI